MPLSESDVARVISTAVECAKRLPPPRSIDCVSGWRHLLEMAPVDDSYPDDKDLPAERPTEDMLACLDRATCWMGWLAERERRIMWLRGHFLGWRTVAREVGLTPRRCQQLWRQSAMVIIVHDPSRETRLARACHWG